MLTTFEATTDFETVQQLLTDPRVYRLMVNDQAPAREDFQAGSREGIEYVIVRQNGEPVGLFLLKDAGSDAEVHFSFTPEAWGATEGIGKAFIEWTWIHRAYRRLLGPVPAYNRLALRLAKRCGFELLDLKRAVLRKNGRPYDLVLLEIRRPLHHD